MAPGGNCVQTSSLPLATLQELRSWSYLAPLLALWFMIIFVEMLKTNCIPNICYLNEKRHQLWSEHLCIPPTPNSYVKILTLIVLVLESGAFGRWWGHESQVLMNGMNALKEGAEESSPVSSAMWSFSGKMSVWGSGLSPDTKSRCLGLELCSLQNYEKWIFVSYKLFSLCWTKTAFLLIQ